MPTPTPSLPNPGTVVAAGNFRDDRTTLWIRGPGVAMPRCCACCLTAENLIDEPLALVGRKETIPFPICPACRRHSKIDSALIGVSLLVGLVGPPVVYWLLAGTTFFGRMRGFMLLALLYLVAALLLAGGAYLLLRRFFVATTVDCADSSWPVAERPSISFGGAAGRNERTDEREERLFIEEFKPRLGADHVALQFSNHEFARRVLEANGAGHLNVRHIARAL